ncbi:Cof-type HAD-IIB family hydrolase [Lactobacillus sp. ESL0677]|uniref:Cof-type HAD-IIB family hydrolase n=1 Tax=Lactobacillus sp. ESL0677 TaxID=2983208 RepID=UPI0023FA4A48|nr:Cof-type HAD-IIB family hydrolase [Lactobacillus sp. ESL0677]WEV37951.1 Cof-type HAD-IIB family hydrolase [Lactobacillus sp. ESL0677]
MMVKLLFSDIDGTLINSDLQVTPRTRDAIRKQVIKDNIFVPVSGRMPQGIMTAAGQIMKRCPLIAYNGALVLDEMGRPLNSQFMTAAQAEEICQYVERKNNGTVWNVYSGYDWYYFPGNNCELVGKEEKTVDVKATPSSLAQVKKLKGAHKVLIMGDPKLLDEEQAELKVKYPKLYIVKSAPNLLEVMIKGVSKGNGIKILAEDFNVKLTDCWAFGDNYNDAAMLEIVAHPVLMANAPADLKAKFEVITQDNNHDGIADVLEQLD